MKEKIFCILRRITEPVSLLGLLSALTILWGCFLVSCSENKERAIHPFEKYFDFSEEILRLEKENPLIKKNLTKGEKTESITDTVNWKNELAPFLEADINKPQFKDSYEIISKENSVKYVSKEKNLPVKIMEILYSEDEISEVFIKREVDNFITKSHYELRYFPKNGYSISAKQSVLFLYNEEFFLEGKFTSVKEGKWRVALKIKTENSEEEIPFHFNLKKMDGQFSAEILNAEEKIFCNEVFIKKDSIFISPPVFQSQLKGKFISDTLIEGAWYNYSKGADYIIPFVAEFAKEERFKNNPENVRNSISIEGKWETEFNPNSTNTYNAVGIFKQKEKNVSGTFLTETGDYRFLEGNFSNDILSLSCFDGSHAFLFKAILKDEKLSGTFYSGIHSRENFTAKKNENAKLTHPDSLTFLREGFSQFSFSFPDLDSNIISLSDKKFQNKVVIVEVMGSWCPNCLDETVFLSEIYKNHHANGLEIVSLCFERSPEFSKAKNAVLRFKQQLNAPYDFLIAGIAGTKNANEKLPMLNHIMSFPTTIFIDKKGKVRKIHTGFYGPGTGEYHAKFKEEITLFVEKLLGE